MPFEAIDLQERIGTEIRSDVATLLQPEVGAKVRELLVRRGVLVFKEIHMTDQQQVAFARLLGTLRGEGKEGIFKITLDTKANANADYLKGSFLWHLDGTHDDVPVFASLLSGLVLSKTGGQTEFANSYAAYEALPEATKRRIDDLKVMHSVETSMTRAGIDATEANLKFWRSIPDKMQPLVWKHKTGRKSLVVGCHAKAVVGMDKQESDELLQELLEWTTQPRFVHRHEWSVGDLIIWDNTGVLHRAEPYPADSGRMMHRTTLMGEEAFA